MKSSSKLINSQRPAQVLGWSPEEFVTVPPQILEEQRQEILAIFQALTGPRVQPRTGLRRNGPETQGIAAWQPAEVDWTPPFTVEDWSFANGQEEQPLAAQQALDQAQLKRIEEEAGQILEQARLQAEEIILQAQQTADDTYAQAQDEINHAKEQGYHEGWSSAQAEADGALRAAYELIQQVNLWRAELFAQSQNMIVEVVQDIARAMFGEGVRLEEQALELNLNRVMESAKSLGDLLIYLNPRDASVLDSSWRNYQSQLTGNKVQIVPSEGIMPGGCFVQGRLGTVDARVETKLQAILDSFQNDELITGSEA